MRGPWEIDLPPQLEKNPRVNTVLYSLNWSQKHLIMWVTEIMCSQHERHQKVVDHLYVKYIGYIADMNRVRDFTHFLTKFVAFKTALVKQRPQT